jgi:hypothetical protein
VTPRLTRCEAPAYWTRWAATHPTTGQHLGTIEKRGGFAAWTALDAEGRLTATMLPTRAAALAALKGNA